MTTFFFGPNMDEKLTIERFLEFQQQLQREILSLEFMRKNPGMKMLINYYKYICTNLLNILDENGLITEADFAELLLAYAGYPQKKKMRMLKRVKKTFVHYI